MLWTLLYSLEKGQLLKRNSPGNKICAQLHKPKFARRGKREGRRVGKEKFFEVVPVYKKDFNIVSTFSILVKEQWDLLQPKIHHLTACLLLGRRDPKIQYHYKTMDRPNCVATFLKSSDEKDSLTELHFQTLTLCVCLQKACLLVGHMETHTHAFCFMAEHDWQVQGESWGGSKNN